MNDGPLDTIATRSPSWISVSPIVCTSLRTCGVYLRLEVQIVDEDQQHAAGGVVGARLGARQHEAFRRRRGAGGGSSRLKVRPP